MRHRRHYFAYTTAISALLIGITSSCVQHVVPNCSPPRQQESNPLEGWFEPDANLEGTVREMSAQAQSAPPQDSEGFSTVYFDADGDGVPDRWMFDDDKSSLTIALGNGNGGYHEGPRREFPIPKSSVRLTIVGYGAGKH